MKIVSEYKSFLLFARGVRYRDRKAVEVTLGGEKISDVSLSFNTRGVDVIVPASYITSANLPADLEIKVGSEVVRRESLVILGDSEESVPSNPAPGGEAGPAFNLSDKLVFGDTDNPWAGLGMAIVRYKGGEGVTSRGVYGPNPLNMHSDGSNLVWDGPTGLYSVVYSVKANFWGDGTDVTQEDLGLTLGGIGFAHSTAWAKFDPARIYTEDGASSFTSDQYHLGVIPLHTGQVLQPQPLDTGTGIEAIETKLIFAGIVLA